VLYIATKCLFITSTMVLRALRPYVRRCVCVSDNLGIL